MLFIRKPKYFVFRVILMSIIPLQMSLFIYAQGGVWTTRADMLNARGYLSTCSVNGKIYAVGGGIDIAKTSSAVEEYDPVTNIWTAKPNLPESRMGQALCQVNGKIYVFGGAVSALGNICSNVYSYDPSIDTCWNIESDMNAVRGYFSASVVNGKIYLIGGANIPNSNGLNTLEEYDPETGKYTLRKPMPTARSLLATAVVKGKIYAIGGAETKYGPVLNTLEEYDPSTNTWTTKADMHTARGWLAASVVNDKIYVIGGASDSNTNPNLESVEVYDPLTDTWAEIESMLTARRTHSACAVDERVYVIGGITGGWGNLGQVSGKVEAYTPQSATSIINEESQNLVNFLLFQNFPNPFNPSTTILYSIPKESFVTIKVYNNLGKEIATLVNKRKAKGNYAIDFNSRNLSSGIYFYQLKTGEYISTKKMILLK